jgi:hypothetical protein
MLQTKERLRKTIEERHSLLESLRCSDIYMLKSGLRMCEMLHKVFNSVYCTLFCYCGVILVVLWCHQFSCHVGFQFRMFEYMSRKLSVKFVKTIDLA